MDRPGLDGSLGGLRVLDFTRVLAGPFCTMFLADLGAEVLKIEQPGRGDETRAWGPPYVGDDSAYYLCVNRNKRSLALDLSREEARDMAAQLASHADVLIENFRPGWLAARGLGYDRLAAENPGLIFASLTGFGQDGPDRDSPGYDFLVQARSGLMSITGFPDGPPTKVGVAVSDIITGLYAAAGILAALERRRQSGRGACVDLALLDCQFAALVNVAADYLATGRVPPRPGNAHASIVPYEVFAASDGLFVLAVGNDRQWQRLAHALGSPPWMQASHLESNAGRVRNREEVSAGLRRAFVTRPLDAWLKLLREADVPAAPIQDLEAAARDPQLLAREMLLESSTPAGLPLAQTANPLLRGRTPVSPPPALNEGGEEMARRWLETARQENER